MTKINSKIKEIDTNNYKTFPHFINKSQPKYNLKIG